MNVVFLENMISWKGYAKNTFSLSKNSKAVSTIVLATMNPWLASNILSALKFLVWCNLRILVKWYRLRTYILNMLWYNNLKWRNTLPTYLLLYRKTSIQKIIHTMVNVISLFAKLNTSYLNIAKNYIFDWICSWKINCR